MAAHRQGIMSIPLPVGAEQSEILRHHQYLTESINIPLVATKGLRVAVGAVGFCNMAVGFLLTYGIGDKVYNVGNLSTDRHLSLFAEFLTPETFVETIPRPVNAVKDGFYRAIHEQLVTAHGAFNTDFSDIWTPAPVGVADTRHHEMILCDGQIGMFQAAFPPIAPGNWVPWDRAFMLLSESAWNSPNSTYKKSFYRMLFTILTSISKIGQITEEKIETMSDQIKSECGINMKMTPDGISALFNVLCKASRDWVVPLQVVLRQGFQFLDQNTMMRMYLTMTQSADSGVSGVNIVANAMSQFPRAKVWVYIAQECPTELTRALDAITMVNTDPYIVFGAPEQRQLVRATQFGNVYYAAKELLSKVGGAKNVQAAKTASLANKKIMLDHLIERDIEEKLQEVTTGDYTFAEGENILSSRDGFQDTLNHFLATV